MNKVRSYLHSTACDGLKGRGWRRSNWNSRETASRLGTSAVHSTTTIEAGIVYGWSSAEDSQSHRAMYGFLLSYPVHLLHQGSAFGRVTKEEPLGTDLAAVTCGMGCWHLPTRGKHARAVDGAQFWVPRKATSWRSREDKDSRPMSWHMHSIKIATKCREHATMRERELELEHEHEHGYEHIWAQVFTADWERG